MYTAYTITAPPELHDILVAMLAEVGFDSFEQREAEVVAYAERTNRTEALQSLREVIGSYGLSYNTMDLEDKNWNEEWERAFTPIRVDDRLLIRATFHATEPGIPLELVIDPKMSFGTGHHATTYMMCEFVLAYFAAGPSGPVRLLDYGCGTGILAILAKLLGASTVDAVDIESWAVENSAENARLNNVTLDRLILGTLPDILGGKPYDVVLANINRNVLLESAATLNRHIRPGGRAYLSGILMQDEGLVVEHYRQAGFRHLRSVAREDWRAFEFFRE